MEYVTLGKTGLKVSRVGFGGIPIQKVNTAGAEKLMKAVCDKGINFIDTARAYTVSEELIGNALVGMRDKFVIATKSMARTRDAMAADIETSLKNLKTDYIDIYQIHNVSMDQLALVCGEGGALEALNEAKKQGKIGHIGLTAHSLEVFEYAASLEWVETLMFPYNIVETQGEDIIKKCRENNVGFICMKPLAGGALENGTLAMRFIAANENVDVIIPGMCNEREVEINVSAVCDKSPLSESELAEIEKIRRELGTNFCRRCNYCQPCAAGINISGVFLFGGYLERYGLEDWARARYATLSSKASACIGCGACESRCPYNLPIREMLKKYAVAFGE
jgi:predicted aldo/keto reductase-like oxidoreductase